MHSIKKSGTLTDYYLFNCWWGFSLKNCGFGKRYTQNLKRRPHPLTVHISNRLSPLTDADTDTDTDADTDTGNLLISVFKSVNCFVNNKWDCDLLNEHHAGLRQYIECEFYSFSSYLKLIRYHLWELTCNPIAGLQGECSCIEPRGSIHFSL